MYRFVAVVSRAAVLFFVIVLAGSVIDLSVLGFRGEAAAQFLTPTNAPPGNNEGSFAGIFEPSPTNLGNFTPQPQVACQPRQFTSNFGPPTCSPNQFGGGQFGSGGFGSGAFGPTTSFGTTPFASQIGPGGFSTGAFANSNTGFIAGPVPSTTPFANPPGFNPSGFGTGAFNQPGFSNFNTGFATGGVASTAPFVNGPANTGGFNTGGFNTGGFNAGGFNSGGFNAGGFAAGGGLGGHSNQFGPGRHPQAAFGHSGGYPDGHAGGHPGAHGTGHGGHGGHSGGPTGITLTSPNIVWEVQQSLATLAIDPGPVDGIYGPKTRRGIKQYQRRLGYYPDGVISEGLLFYLRKDVKRYVSPAVDFRRVTSIGPARPYRRPHGHGGHPTHPSVSPRPY